MRTQTYPRSGSRRELLEGVVEAINKVEDPAARAAAIESLRVRVPRVSWLTNRRGLLDAAE